MITVTYMIGERLGRRRTIWLAMAFVLVGAILQTTAFTVPHLIVGRLVTGCGTGIKTSTVPMLVFCAIWILGPPPPPFPFSSSPFCPSYSVFICSK
jgi:MFS family permease